MEKSEVAETATARAIFARPNHDYTRVLMRATRRPGIKLRDLLPAGAPAAAIEQSTVSNAAFVSVKGLVKEYPRVDARGFVDRYLRNGKATKPAPFRAVDGISFDVRHGESVGLVGESGCGKSTTSMIIMHLLDPTLGRIIFNGQEIGGLPARTFAGNSLRSRIQMVFRDPTDSLNPRFTSIRAISDPVLRLDKSMPSDALRARCIALNPDLIILDEPTALDVSIQAVVLNLLADLKASLGRSYLFVSHDLHVGGLLCDRVIVMKNDQIVEEGVTKQVFATPVASYTREMIAAIPHPPRDFSEKLRQCSVVIGCPRCCATTLRGEHSRRVSFTSSILSVPAFHRDERKIHETINFCRLYRYRGRHDLVLRRSRQRHDPDNNIKGRLDHRRVWRQRDADISRSAISPINRRPERWIGFWRLEKLSFGTGK